jgi:hypothetical protein
VTRSTLQPRDVALSSARAAFRALTVTRQLMLEVEPVPVGREVRFRVVGAELAETARRLDVVGAAWDRRLAALKRVAEGL